MEINRHYDAIIIGSGMGGMSAGALLANDGYKVLILEAALHPGGCSSSYPRKGYVFESGATTLVGFDEHQPLRILEEKTGIDIPRVELNPPMKVWIDNEPVVRYKDLDKWINESVRVFGNEGGQRKFWKLAKKISDIVWRVSSANPWFPPQNGSDWINLFSKNNPFDAWVLKYAFKSVQEVAESFEINSPKFLRFLDEQLMITAQSKSGDTPFLFGAAGLTYTNYSNYYVPGGLIKMINKIKEFIESKGGKLHTKEGVNIVEKNETGFLISTAKGKKYEAPIVISNIPIWNMKDICSGDMQEYFRNESDQFNEAWGAITMGIAVKDTFPEDLGIHHQLHLGSKGTVPFTESESIFVSMSKKGDTDRAPEGMRTLNVSCHASPDTWFAMNGEYDRNKEKVHEFIIQSLNEKLPGFSETEIDVADTATPVSWENWVSRKKGRVGGIPQSMARSLLNWTPNKTPFEGLYMVGDTTYPGQGIPGVTLSGINVYYRVRKNQK